MNQRLFPVTEAFFKKAIQLIIEKNYIWKGRPPEISHYKVFCAIMYVLRTGIPWRDLPKCYGCWHTVYQRFKRGSEKGIWWKILMILQQGKKITMNTVISDSSTFKMHRQGWRIKRGIQSKGKSRGGIGTKLHLTITAEGHIIEGFLTGANRHDISYAEDLTEGIVGCYILQDRGDDSNKNRQNIEAQNNIPVIPGRKNRKTEVIYDQAKYKLRGAIERFFGKLKENRRLALRYEKDDMSFLSFVAIAAIKMNLC